MVKVEVLQSFCHNGVALQKGATLVLPKTDWLKSHIKKGYFKLIDKNYKVVAEAPKNKVIRKLKNK